MTAECSCFTPGKEVALRSVGCVERPVAWLRQAARTVVPAQFLLLVGSLTWAFGRPDLRQSRNADADRRMWLKRTASRAPGSGGRP